MEAKWIARLILLLFFMLVMYFWFRKKKIKKDFIGLKNGYKVDTTIVKDIIKWSQITKKKKRYNKTEEMCRDIIETLYKAPFPSIRPDFLKSPKTGRNLELDCYNSDLGIAIEYNGQQHYKYCPHFHKAKKDFYSQVHRDDWKRKKCKELGIILIEIPYWVPPHKLEPFIVKQLKNKGCY